MTHGPVRIATPNQKRSRSTRGSTKSGDRPSLGFLDALKDRQTLGRFSALAAWLIGLVAVVECWEPPFAYRQGDYIARGIDSRTEFERIDLVESERRRRDAADLVPLVFINDPSGVLRLPERLRADLGELSAAKAIEDVAPATREAFGFGPEIDQEEAQATYQRLREAILPAGPLTTEDRIKDILSELANFVSPLLTRGVIDPADIRRLNIERTTELRVRESQTDVVSNLIEPIPVTRVQLSFQLSDGGELGSKWLSYPHLDPIKEEIKQWVSSQLAPTLRFDEESTDAAIAAARAAVPDAVESFSAGEPLVARQTLLDDDQLALLRAEHEAVVSGLSTLDRVLRLILAFALILVLIILNGYYIGRIEPRAMLNVGRVIIYSVAMIVTVGLARTLSFDPWRAEIAPVLLFTMVFCVAYSQVFATVASVTVCLLVNLSTTSDVRQFVVLIATSAAATLLIGRVQNRTTLIRVGFLTGLVYIGVFFAMRAIGDPIPLEFLTSSGTLREAFLGGTWCLFCGFLVTGLLPFVESRFGVVTDMSLLELSNASHPLLQELVQQAPGTYNHSLSVGSIAESAAESIGANGLLCRVAALFHDCGKMLKPTYFIENLGSGEQSPHKQLAPAMSKLVIIGHVKDGVDLAEQHNLPQPIIDFIEQHHGTTLVEYFFREASRKAEGKPEARTDAEEESFRYPGPKPQTREAGVMMIADACESASRAMTDPTPKRLEQLVRDLTMKRLLDGQFDECNLTLSDLHKIELSIAKSLTAIYHGRIKYPDAKSA